MKRIILIAVALLLFATTTPVAAQTTSNTNISASVTILASLSCVKTRDIAYGSVLSSSGQLFTNTTTNYGQVTCTTDAGNMVSISFSLPAGMTGPGGSVPLGYGPASAEAIDGGDGPTQFNPSTGLASFSVLSGNLTINLGRGSSSANQVSADVTGKSPGSYSAVIVATVSVL